ncbi:hypothetical protein OSTOST_13867 [Ostertagia ostertagi]
MVHRDGDIDEDQRPGAVEPDRGVEAEHRGHRQRTGRADRGGELGRERPQAEIGAGIALGVLALVGVDDVGQHRRRQAVVGADAQAGDDGDGHEPDEVAGAEEDRKRHRGRGHDHGHEPRSGLAEAARQEQPERYAGGRGAEIDQQDDAGLQLVTLQHVLDVEQHDRNGDAQRRAIHDEHQKQAAEQPVLQRGEERDQGLDRETALHVPGRRGEPRHHADQPVAEVTDVDFRILPHDGRMHRGR